MMQDFIAVEDAKNLLERIQRSSDDDEAAHSLEDQLHYRVLLTITELSKVAVETSKIDFARWCA